MNIRMRVVPLFAAGLALSGLARDGVAVATAAPQSLHFDLVANIQLQQPVEQQSDYPFDSSSAHYVVNPTQCSWDVDDSWQRIATDDYLDSGATVRFDTCMVSDARAYYTSRDGTSAWWGSNRGYFGALIHAPVATLAVTVCYSPQNRCFHPQPQFNSAQKRYDYVACTQVVYAQDEPALASIPNSNGGTGVVSSISLSVGNPTSKQIRSIGADLRVVGVGAQFDGGVCGYAPLPAHDYPWFFSVSGSA